jgi:methylated-DNA-[protein]-cysteine S-methyltransferase
MTILAFTLFETAIGPCALVWNARAIAGVQLPEADSEATRRRLRARFPEALEAPPPTDLVPLRDKIVALLEGEKIDLSAAVLDMAGVPEFYRRVYDVARRIGPGEIATYGAIARRIGADRAARAVGQALGRNPFPILVPCHRVLAANGALGGFSAHGGIETKRRLLEIEGASPAASRRVESRAAHPQGAEAGRHAAAMPR